MSKFLDGLMVKRPHPNAPDFVKAKISIKREELIKSLQEQSGEWLNLDVKESRDGKWYAQIDDWKPASTPTSKSDTSDFDDDIPF